MFFNFLRDTGLELNDYNGLGYVTLSTFDVTYNICLEQAKQQFCSESNEDRRYYDAGINQNVWVSFRISKYGFTTSRFLEL